MASELTLEWERIDGEDLCFLVRSESRPRIKFRVELEPYDFNGWCACERFEFNYQPKLEKGERAAAGSDRLRCKHLKFIRNVLLDCRVIPLIANRSKGKNERPYRITWPVPGRGG
jgi:hypothetical protein